MELDMSGTQSYDAANLSIEDLAAPLDNLLHFKSSILKSKLEVLASEIFARLAVWDRNVARIDEDKTQVEGLLSRLAQQARYHLRDHRDKNQFYKQMSDLEVQRRSQDVECWRDIVFVMRDFLAAWEAHEQSKNRAIFFNNAGSGLENHL